MSTRAQIVVEGIEEVKFYKHSDGYPEGVLPVLEPFVQGFLQKEGGTRNTCWPGWWWPLWWPGATSRGRWATG